jgi:transcription antitermination protein NusB
MGYRRKAREFALQMLFQMEFNNSQHGLREVFWKTHPATEPIREFADCLVSGVIQNIKSIDEMIQKHSQHWELKRMTSVDRNILRMAIFELQALENIPIKVTLNEAIEIAKRYGDEASGSFVNGILDHITKEEGAIVTAKGVE